MNQVLPLELSGKVIHGAGRGRTLGFPTANLDTQLPADLPLGIYAGWVWITNHSTRRPVVIYWGQRPTFGEQTTDCEVFLIDATENLDVAELQGKLTSFIRADKRYDSPSDLIKQMHQDVAEARQRLGLP